MKHLLLTTIGQYYSDSDQIGDGFLPSWVWWGLWGCSAIIVFLPFFFKRMRGFRSNSESEYSIHAAAGSGSIDEVKKQLANGTDVNKKNGIGMTPLCRAVQWGHREISELLISEGANINTKNDDGETPLDLATLFNQSEIADLLRKHGGKTGEELKAEGK